MTDDKIHFFIAHTRQLLDYVESGVIPTTPADGETDVGNSE